MSYTYAQLQERVAEAIGDPVGGRSLKLAQDAIREAVIELNAQVWRSLFTQEEITLVTGQREYSPASNFKAHGFTWLLRSDNAAIEKPIPFLPPLTFFRAGYEKNANTGLPVFMTYEEDTAKYVIDREPTSNENGRKLRVAYWYSISNPPTTIDDDNIGHLVVACAQWRVRRMVPGYDWQTDKRYADLEKLRVRSMTRSLDVFANAAR